MSGNARKERFLNSIPLASIDDPEDTLAGRCKFNFSYFTKQDAGQDFSDWDQEKLVKLLNKLKDYTGEPLSYWKKQPVGKSGSVLAIYGAFPKKSDFTHPKHVPHQALWGRFRLDHSARLVGFVLPQASHKQLCAHASGELFDCNTFYVVFLDENHAFYKTEEK